MRLASASAPITNHSSETYTFETALTPETILAIAKDAWADWCVEHPESDPTLLDADYVSAEWPPKGSIADGPEQAPGPGRGVISLPMDLPEEYLRKLFFSDLGPGTIG